MKQRARASFEHVQTTLAVPTERPDPRPWAQRMQRTAEQWDDLLVILARRSRPGVFWWWGARTFDHKHGAYCYICEDFVCTWARRFPITVEACDSIDEHRTRHYADALALAETAE